MDQDQGSGSSSNWDRVVDVIVVGQGAAGCAAALEGSEAGAETLVLEKMPEGRDGGNTRVSGGIWFQHHDPEGIATYLRAMCGEYPVPEDVIRVWAQETQRNSAWIESLGAAIGVHGEYVPEYPELPGSEAYAGYLGIEGQMGNGRLFGVLKAALAARGIEVLLETPARELVQDPASGEILGVLVTSGSQELRLGARRGVVLATGGFENNAEMVRDYLRLTDVPVWGSPAGTGDGIKMAQKVGADLWHMDNMMTTLGLRAPGFEAGFYVAFNHAQGFLCVGMDGTRISNELPQVGHGQAVLNGSYELFPTSPMHVIFDEATRRAGPISPTRDELEVGWNVVIENYDWSRDNSTEIEKGWIQRADTLDELGPKLGVDGKALTQSVQHYNRSCAEGFDAAFGRDPDTLVPVSEPPFYGFTSAPMLGWSNGGPRRDEQARVIDALGDVIPRLYAAGCISSTYSWCKDGGMHIADALAFGRVAGRGAAAEAPLGLTSSDRT
ncbi:FAD-dependent oxidoreductase [Myxococcota bacterium]|nr:FAD-dependent oxidoreductase [Myxococcota bacterium]